MTSPGSGICRAASERLLRDIISVTLALHPSIGEQLRSELEALGWPVEREADRGQYRALGPEAEIVVRPVPQGQPYGIRVLTFSLVNSSTTREVYDLGNSRLEVCARAARWTFGAPSNLRSARSRNACEVGRRYMRVL